MNMKTSQGQVEQTKGEVFQREIKWLMLGAPPFDRVPSFDQFDNLYGGTTKFGVPRGVDQSVKINHTKVC